ncbi:hypothetical protein [Hydrogenimonas sp.]
MKKLLFLSLLAVSLIAGQYAKLKDGSIVILKEDGTWEKVETLPQGTGAAPAPGPVRQSGQSDALFTRSTPGQQAAAPIRSSVDPLAREYARKLLGTWESADGRLKYIVEDETVTFVDGRRQRTGRYRIQSIRPEKRKFILNIGEFGSAGYFSFGGIMRKLAFSSDFTRLTDHSAPMPTELRKVK